LIQIAGWTHCKLSGEWRCVELVLFLEVERGRV